MICAGSGHRLLQSWCCMIPPFFVSHLIPWRSTAGCGKPRLSSDLFRSGSLGQTAGSDVLLCFRNLFIIQFSVSILFLLFNFHLECAHGRVQVHRTWVETGQLQAVVQHNYCQLTWGPPWHNGHRTRCLGSNFSEAWNQASPAAPGSAPAHSREHIYHARDVFDKMHGWECVVFG